MRTLVTADWHCSANPRDAYRFVFLESTLPKLIKEHNVDCVYILGDLTEAKDEHSARLVNRLARGLADIAYDMAELVISKGNHDYIDAEHPFFEFIGDLPHTTYVSKPKRIGQWLVLPHTRDPERDWKNISMSDVERIFAHQTFSGAVGDNGFKLEGVDLGLLPFVPILSGDVHVPQRIKNLTYVGAPYTIDFGDDYAGRVILIDNRTNEIMSVPVDGPQKVLCRAKNLDDLDKLDLLPDDVVRVELPIRRANYAEWFAIVREVREWAAENSVKLDSVLPVVVEPKTSKQPTTRKVQPKVSDEVLVKEYAKANKVDEATLKVGLELLT